MPEESPCPGPAPADCPLDETEDGLLEAVAGSVLAPEGAEDIPAVQPPSATHKGAVDLTEGHLLRGIVLLSWPILTGSLLNWLMGVADIKMVGALGPEAIAAVGQSQNIMFLIMALVLAVATSIDALAVGVTFSMVELSVSIWLAVCLIGCTTFLISLGGVYVGNVFGAKYKNKAEFVGGTILILIGVKIILEHFGVL